MERRGISAAGGKVKICGDGGDAAPFGTADEVESVAKEAARKEWQKGRQRREVGRHFDDAGEFGACSGPPPHFRQMRRQQVMLPLAF